MLLTCLPPFLSLLGFFPPPFHVLNFEPSLVIPKTGPFPCSTEIVKFLRLIAYICSMDSGFYLGLCYLFSNFWGFVYNFSQIYNKDKRFYTQVHPEKGPEVHPVWKSENSKFKTHVRGSKSRLAPIMMLLELTILYRSFCYVRMWTGNACTPWRFCSLIEPIITSSHVNLNFECPLLHPGCVSGPHRDLNISYVYV